jgi:septum site-determining protein MinD
MTRIIGIVSAKGGVGKTTVATNLALALRKFDKKVILIDCNVSTPHLAQNLGVSDYKYTLNDVLLGKVDLADAMNRYDGIFYIPASLNLEDLFGVDPIKLRKTLSKLSNSEMIDFIILDSAPTLGREALSALDASDELIYVTTPILPNIQDVERCLEIANELNKENLGVVLNMVENSNFETRQKEIKEVLKLPILGTIPFDKNIVRGLVKGKPIMKLKPHSQTSSNFLKIAAKLVGSSYKPHSGRALLNFFDMMREFISRD